MVTDELKDDPRVEQAVSKLEALQSLVQTKLERQDLSSALLALKMIDGTA